MGALKQDKDGGASTAAPTIDQKPGKSPVDRALSRAMYGGANTSHKPPKKNRNKKK